jgi:hypothetical protein
MTPSMERAAPTPWPVAPAQTYSAPSLVRRSTGSSTSTRPKATASFSGMTHSESQVGADVVVNLGGGDQFVLVGVTLASLTGDWIGA